MNAVEGTRYRSKLEAQVYEYHGSLGSMRKNLAEYFRAARFKLDLFKYLQRQLVIGNNF